MARIGVRCSKDVTQLGGPNYICHIKSQFFKNAYDEAIIAEWSIGEMGHIALPIQDAIPATKSYEGTANGRLLG